VPRAVASVCLNRGVFPTGGGSTPLTAAPDTTLLVKNLVFFNESAESALIQAWMSASDRPGAARVVYQDLPTSTAIQIQTWIALNPGDSLVLFSTIGAVSFWVSGSMLQGAAPYTPPPPLFLATKPGEQRVSKG
jgi:hypothetical protein